MQLHMGTTLQETIVNRLENEYVNVVSLQPPEEHCSRITSLPDASNFEENLSPRSHFSNSANNFHFSMSEHVMDIRRYFFIGEELGSGASGAVHRCLEYSSGEMYACKIISKARMPQNMGNLFAEIQSMGLLSKHPNVLSLKGVLEDFENVYIFTEICEGGDLYSYLEDRDHFLESECASICRSIASVLAHAHRNGIMHRDVKPENIFVTSKGDLRDVRLGDFGSAGFFSQDKKLSQVLGSPLYVAPSVLEGSYGPEADLWSLGVVLYVMLSGLSPFSGSTDSEVLESVLNEEVKIEGGPWKHISGGAKHLLCRLLDRDDKTRITADEIENHPWIQYHCHSPRKKRSFKLLSPKKNLVQLFK